MDELMISARNAMNGILGCYRGSGVSQWPGNLPLLQALSMDEFILSILQRVPTESGENMTKNYADRCFDMVLS